MSSKGRHYYVPPVKPTTVAAALPDASKWQWQKLPHWWDAWNEANQIVRTLWHDKTYGRSRRYNSRGTKCHGQKRRFCDRWTSEREAVWEVTKVILRDKYGETPMAGGDETARQHGDRTC